MIRNIHYYNKHNDTTNKSKQNTHSTHIIRSDTKILKSNILQTHPRPQRCNANKYINNQTNRNTQHFENAKLHTQHKKTNIENTNTAIHTCQQLITSQTNKHTAILTQYHIARQQLKYQQNASDMQ